MFNKKVFEKIKYIVILGILIGLPLMRLISYILFKFDIISSPIFVNSAQFLWALIPILIIIYICDIIFNKSKITIFDYLVYGILVLNLLSCVFSKNFKITIFGNSIRCEGLLTLITYYLIFLNSKNIKNKKMIKNIITVFFLVGVFQVIYSFLQEYTNLKIITLYNNTHIASGLCTNPNFFGSYMVILASLSTTLALLKKSYIYFLLTLIYFFGLCLCASSGPFLSYILVLIFLCGYFIFKRKKSMKKHINKRKFLIFSLICVLSLILFLSVPKIMKKIGNKDVNDTRNILTEINENLSNIKNMDNGRFSIWKQTLKISSKHIILGIGPDQLGNYYPRLEKIGKTTYKIDKAHNIYLETLVTTGIFSLIIYLTICFLIFIIGFKLKNDLGIALWISFIGYSIQGFANISVIEVAPYFYLILGLVLSIYNNFNNKEI